MFTQSEITEILSTSKMSIRRDGMEKLMQSNLREKFKAFVAQLPPKPRHSQILHHVRLNTCLVPKCRCGKPVVWSPSKGQYSDFCSTACGIEFKQATLDRLKSDQKTVQVTSKDIECFSRLYSELGQKIHTRREYYIVQRLTDRLTAIWVSLPGKTKSKVLILTGQIPKQAYCACGNPINGFMNSGHWRKFCSKQCATSDADTQKLRLKAFQQKYGKGVTNAMQVPGAMAKRKRTLRKRYGVDHPAKIDTFAEKRKATMQRRYGVDHAFQLKTFCQNKEVVLNGRRQLVQGFEPQALEFIKRFVKERDIVLASSGKVPTVQYMKAGKTKMYYPDMMIRGTNTLVEVKSKFTFAGRRDWFETLKLKRKACIDSGYVFRLLVIGQDGKRVLPPKNWHALSFDKITFD